MTRPGCAKVWQLGKRELAERLASEQGGVRNGGVVQRRGTL